MIFRLLRQRATIDDIPATATNNTTIDDIPATETNNPKINDITGSTAENVAVFRAVSFRKPRKKKRFIPPVKCRKCSKEIKGNCSSCLIKELQLIIKEKDKENRQLKRKISTQIKSIVGKDSKLDRLKDRMN